MIKIYRIRVYGKVQGVHFRESTKGVADLLKVKGWIRNEPNGTVLMEVKVEERALDEFLDWCKEGPDRAKVEKVEIEELDKPQEEVSQKIKFPFINFDILK